MATPIHPWNPYQDLTNSKITDELIQVNTANRKAYVPRAAPFFSRNMVLYTTNINTPLELGKDYVFANPFDGFISQYNRNAFGCIIFISDINATVKARYDTIGNPFVLEDVRYAQYVASVLEAPRESTWDIIMSDTIPDTFPVYDHEQPISQTYDYEEFMTQIRSLILALIDDRDNANALATLLNQHINQDATQAHGVNLTTLGLDKIPNIDRATTSDLNTGTNNKLITVSSAKSMFDMYQKGSLNL